MALERRSPGEDSPWEIVIDKPMAREYVQCKHCAGYGFFSDMLKRAWIKSGSGLVNQVTRVVMCARELGVMFGFLRHHLVCATIWLEGHRR